MDYLPTEITTQILSRLPVRSVYVCRCVCKTWLNIIDDCQRFAPLHFTRSLEQEEEQEATTFIFVPNGNRRPIYLVEVKQKQYICKTTQIDFCGPDYNTKYANSCNGLLCFSSTPSNIDNEYHTYIHNPATRECVKLPSSFSCRESKKVNLGFGYDHSSNAFKVLQFLCVRDGFGHPTSMKAQVFTLGTNSWRQLENFPCVPCYPSTPVLINGSLHWLSYEHILSFDLVSENFGLVEYPQRNMVPTALYGFNPENNFQLVVLNGCLSITCSYPGEDIGLWIMKDYNVKESWIKLVIKRNYLKDGIFDTLKDRVLFQNVLPITFWKNGELLLLYGSKILISYEIESGRYTVFEFEGLLTCKFDFFFKSYSWSEVYPYVGNLMPMNITCRTEGQP
ncbi:hypothetical protein AQUCO_02000051v1 [Aquilegia coerulea]|uniref:F-box domain-containing protein n=1 Tax=Aquilegia coerulea TaxID=218851 RepID=A0A2G5DFT1_AQUCA|nr:hypothetical protein AQUCO_02000051v1 [Aquilegia coerulea]PIA42333.1 hypothetical protein AQUCO_02000051v1 [Aquilegia coerulea]